MSSSGAVTSTCADSVAPPGRRIVTVVLPETTCTFVRIVSGATKKPVPKPPPASTRTTAGIDRLITSSSDSVVAALGTTAGCSAAAAAAFDAASAAATRAAGSRAVSGSGDMGALARCTSARSTTAAAGAGILDGAGAAACCVAGASSRFIQNSIARSAAPRTAATTNIGGDLRCGVSIATGVVSTAAGASDAVSNTWPQRQVATAVGTRRAHSGQRGIGSLIGVWRAAPTSGGLSHLPADAQVQLENGRPSRVMLFVERDPAAPIGRVGRCRGRGGGSAAQMHDLDVGREQHPAAARSHRGAEVDVLRVHEETFVEAANGLGIGAAYQQTRTGHPIGIVALTRQALDRCRRGEPLLPKFVQRRDHPAKRQLGAAVAVDEPRPDDGDVGVAVELSDEPIDGAGGNDRVAVQQQDVERTGRRPA